MWSGKTHSIFSTRMPWSCNGASAASTHLVKVRGDKARPKGKVARLCFCCSRCEELVDGERYESGNGDVSGTLPPAFLPPETSQQLRWQRRRRAQEEQARHPWENSSFIPDKFSHKYFCSHQGCHKPADWLGCLHWWPGELDLWPGSALLMRPGTHPRPHQGLDMVCRHAAEYTLPTKVEVVLTGLLGNVRAFRDDADSRERLLGR